jgi:hypothetical protein
MIQGYTQWSKRRGFRDAWIISASRFKMVRPTVLQSAPLRCLECQGSGVLSSCLWIHGPKLSWRHSFEDMVVLAPVMVVTVTMTVRLYPVAAQAGVQPSGRTRVTPTPILPTWFPGSRKLSGEPLVLRLRLHQCLGTPQHARSRASSLLCPPPHPRFLSFLCTHSFM